MKFDLARTSIRMHHPNRCRDCLVCSPLLKHMAVCQIEPFPRCDGHRPVKAERPGPLAKEALVVLKEGLSWKPYCTSTVMLWVAVTGS
jgi:hypothetical protein